MLPGVSFQVVGPEYLTQNGLILIRQNWSRLSCRANIIRTDRRNLLKLVNKHLGKHIISIFIHEFISLHYYYLIVTFLYYQKCAFNINTTKNRSRLNCRANIIRIDRRNLLKLINKHLGKHIISIFIHEFISLHYYYLIVTFLYYQKCPRTHLQQCIHLKNSGEDPRTTHFNVSGIQGGRSKSI